MSTSASKPAASALWPSSLQSATVDELAQVEREVITSSPGMFAMGTSQQRWQMAKHLAFLDETLLRSIEDAQAGLLDGLLVCMPPQHGKSELISKHLPAWYLGTFPDKRVILTSYEADF